MNLEYYIALNQITEFLIHINTFKSIANGSTRMRVVQAHSNKNQVSPLTTESLNPTRTRPLTNMGSCNKGFQKNIRFNPVYPEKIESVKEDISDMSLDYNLTATSDDLETFLYKCQKQEIDITEYSVFTDESYKLKWCLELCNCKGI